MASDNAGGAIVTNVVSKFDRIMEGCGKWTSYYRCNPHRLAIDYFGMTWLVPFQQALLVLFFRFNYVMVIASRGMGKSQIVAAALVIYCTLYPGTKVVIAAGVRSQSLNVLSKIIDEFYPHSPNLRNEIDTFKVIPSDAFIKWKNGSIIKVVTANEDARSNRAHIVVGDEFVRIKEVIINNVLRKFKAGQRRPGFYDKPKYTDQSGVPKSDDWVYVPKESNKEFYISSASFKHHYSWKKFKSFFKSMMSGENYCVLGFPYQLPVSAGYYPLEQIKEEMQEDTFDSISWSINISVLPKFTEPVVNGVCC